MPSLGAQLAAAILGMGLMSSDAEHQEELLAEAEQMNLALRALEAQKMDATIQGFQPKMAAAERHLLAAVKLAAMVSAAGQDQEKLASLLEQEGMDKEAVGAFIGGLMRAGGAAMKGLGGATKAVGSKLPQSGTQRFMQAAQSAGAGSGAPQGALQRAGGWLQSQGSAMASRGAQVAPAAKAAPSSGPLLSMGTKAKILGGGAMLGAGYLGMKTLQAGRDYMLQPAQQGSWGHAPGLKHNVSQWGYPTS